eukprot:m.241144 g.241144  ORF g.241144 m.241144 type:complete len:417 (+) comp24014_c0_seq1:198-1448(+)
MMENDAANPQLPLDPDYTSRALKVIYPRKINHPGGMCSLANGGIAFCDAPLFQDRCVCVVNPDGSTHEFFHHRFTLSRRIRRPWAIAECSDGEFLVTDAAFGKLIRVSSSGEVRWITPEDPDVTVGPSSSSHGAAFASLAALLSGVYSGPSTAGPESATNTNININMETDGGDGGESQPNSTSAAPAQQGEEQEGESENESDSQPASATSAHGVDPELLEMLLTELVNSGPPPPRTVASGPMLRFPTDVKLLPDGRALVCDNRAQCILIVDPADGRVLGPFQVYDMQGNAVAVSPGSMAVSPDGTELLMLDNLVGSVLFVRIADGHVVRTLGSRGPRADQFQEPLEMVLDKRGNILVSDTGGIDEVHASRIIVFHPDGSTALVEMPGRINGGMLIDTQNRLTFFSDGVLYRTVAMG